MPRPPLLYNWKRDRARHVRPWRASVLSVAAHGLLIFGAVRATDVVGDAMNEQAVPPLMLALMNRAPNSAALERTIFADISYSMEGARQSVDAYTATVIRDKPGDNGADKATSFLLKMDALASDDSIFTSYEVDQIAEALFVGAGPVYPSELAGKHKEGLVIAQYVVDTSGWADTSSVNVLQSSDPLFTSSVRASLGNMRFKPARIGKTVVRQLVQQSFIFRMPADSATR
jgi:hypothetical protein